MKHLNRLIACNLALAAGVGLFTGCASSAPALVNTEEFLVDGITAIDVAYGEDRIHVYRGDPGRVVLKEYMNRDRRRYHADTAASGGKLSIHSGMRPLLGDLDCTVELYLPADYSGALSVSTSSGDIRAGAELHLASLSIDSASGGVSLSHVTADSIRIHTTSGTAECGVLAGDLFAETTSGVLWAGEISGDSVRLESTSGQLYCDEISAGSLQAHSTSGVIELGNVRGTVDIETKSGTVQIVSLTGSGRLDATADGEISVGCARLDGDLVAHTKNGSLICTLPVEQAFHYRVETREGVIDTPFSAPSGSHGDDPAHTVDLSTRNGSITVKIPS